MATAKKVTPASKKSEVKATHAVTRKAAAKSKLAITVNTKPAQRVIAKAAKAPAPISVAAVAKAAINAVRVQQTPAPKPGRTRTQTYMEHGERKKMLDGHLLKLVKTKGIGGTTRAALADAAGCSNSLLRVYYEGGVQGMLIQAVTLAAAAGDAKTVNKAVKDGFPKSSLPRKYHTLVK